MTHLYDYNGKLCTDLCDEPPEPPGCCVVCEAAGPGPQSAAASPQTTATHTASPIFNNNTQVNHCQCLYYLFIEGL